MVARAPRKRMYRSMQGRMIDIEKLRAANENTQAVGNMNVNARGDVLGKGGQIVTPKETVIKDLKVTVRQITKDDIKSRNLPNQTSGLVVTKIANESPLLSSVEVNSIILEAQKKKIRNVNDLNQIVKQVLNSNQKTILLVIYNSQNQRRYIGVKLD